VDAVVPQSDLDKVQAAKRLNFNVLFVGDDWYGNASWEGYESELGRANIKVVYFPYTKGTSSTEINEILEQLRA